MTPAGVFTEFAIPTGGGLPPDDHRRTDGELWFTEHLAEKIGRITPPARSRSGIQSRHREATASPPVPTATSGSPSSARHRSAGSPPPASSPSSGGHHTDREPARDHDRARQQPVVHRVQRQPGRPDRGRRPMAARSSCRRPPCPSSRAACRPGSGRATSASTASRTSARNAWRSSRSTGWPTIPGRSARSTTGPTTCPPRSPRSSAATTELAETTARLAATRLLTLTGPGGTGKTRLSLQLARPSPRSSPTASTSWPSSRSASRPSSGPRSPPSSAWSRTAGRRSASAWPGWIAARQILLVLDNFEQVIDAAPLIGELLRATTELKLIVSSRAAAARLGRAGVPGAGPADAARSGGRRGLRPGPARGPTGRRRPGHARSATSRSACSWPGPRRSSRASG